MIIGFIFFVVFFFLLGKAIIETVWGIALIILGLFMHLIAIFLRTLAFLVRTFNKVVQLFRKPKPAPEKFSTARAINLYFSRMK